MAETATIIDNAKLQPERPQRETGFRRCIVTRSKKQREELLRFVVDPEGRVTPDVAQRLPGRGVWVMPDRQILAKAIKNGRFKAGFKADVHTPDNLIEMTVTLLDRRMIELLGLARGAGQIGAGWEQSQQFSRKHAIGLVLVASDASEGSRRKLIGLARNVPVLDMLDAATLGRALGRERVVNALVSRGRFADLLFREAARRRSLNDGSDDGAAMMIPHGEGSKQ